MNYLYILLLLTMVSLPVQANLSDDVARVIGQADDEQIEEAEMHVMDPENPEHVVMESPMMDNVRTETQVPESSSVEDEGQE